MINYRDLNEFRLLNAFDSAGKAEIIMPLEVKDSVEFLLAWYYGIYCVTFYLLMPVVKVFQLLVNYRKVWRIVTKHQKLMVLGNLFNRDYSKFKVDGYKIRVEGASLIVEVVGKEA